MYKLSRIPLIPPYIYRFELNTNQKYTMMSTGKTRAVVGTAQPLGIRFLPPTDSLCANEPTTNKNSLYGRAIVLTN